VGDVERPVTVAVTSGFALNRLFVYPSPFETVTSFNYELTGSPARVIIEIYTISGRKLVEIAGSTAVGENSVVWEGLDAEGDRVANGLYVYRITATDTDGRKITRLDKIVKVE
jgi:flagellar hook assembly protein FlgD